MDLYVAVGLGGLAAYGAADVLYLKVEVAEDGEVEDPVAARGGGDDGYFPKLRFLFLL